MSTSSDSWKFGVLMDVLFSYVLMDLIWAIKSLYSYLPVFEGDVEIGQSKVSGETGCF